MTTLDNNKVVLAARESIKKNREELELMQKKGEMLDKIFLVLFSAFLLLSLVMYAQNAEAQEVITVVHFDLDGNEHEIEVIVEEGDSMDEYTEEEQAQLQEEIDAVRTSVKLKWLINLFK